MLQADTFTAGGCLWGLFSEYQRNDGEHDEDDDEPLCDSHTDASNSARTHQGGYQRQYEECDREREEAPAPELEWVNDVFVHVIALCSQLCHEIRCFDFYYTLAEYALWNSYQYLARLDALL